MLFLVGIERLVRVRIARFRPTAAVPTLPLDFLALLLGLLLFNKKAEV